MTARKTWRSLCCRPPRGGVDRNSLPASCRCPPPPSPFSRRAWIEIAGCVSARCVNGGRLLTEGVDRNDYGGTPGFWRLNVALLAEGVDRNAFQCGNTVVQLGRLLAEGVDRNIVAIDQFDFLECRPPRGEHTSNPLSIRLHSPSFLQAGHRFGGQQPFSMQTSGGTAFCEPAAGLFRVGSLLQAPTVQTAEDAARRGEHIGHLIFLHDSGQIPAVAVITQQADPAELCCKVHLLR